MVKYFLKKVANLREVIIITMIMHIPKIMERINMSINIIIIAMIMLIPTTMDTITISMNIITIAMTTKMEDTITVIRMDMLTVGTNATLIITRSGGPLAYTLEALYSL